MTSKGFPPNTLIQFSVFQPTHQNSRTRNSGLAALLNTEENNITQKVRTEEPQRRPSSRPLSDKEGTPLASPSGTNEKHIRSVNFQKGKKKRKESPAFQGGVFAIIKKSGGFFSSFRTWVVVRVWGGETPLVSVEKPEFQSKEMSFISSPFRELKTPIQRVKPL